MLADAAGGVDHVELALVAALVGRGEALHHLGRGNAFAQQRQSLSAVMRVDERLGRERADAAFRVRAQRACGEETRRDRHSESATAAVACDDGPGHCCWLPDQGSNLGPAD